MKDGPPSFFTKGIVLKEIVLKLMKEIVLMNYILSLWRKINMYNMLFMFVYQLTVDSKNNLLHSVLLDKVAYEMNNQFAPLKRLLVEDNYCCGVNCWKKNMNNGYYWGDCWSVDLIVALVNSRCLINLLLMFCLLARSKRGIHQSCQAQSEEPQQWWLPLLHPTAAIWCQHHDCCWPLTRAG